MDTSNLLDPTRRNKAWLAFLACILSLLIAEVIAWGVQNDFGRLEVSNVSFENYNGIPIRAKLFKPANGGSNNPVPGVVYIHGYQNNRETSDAYAIEIARRGMVVLEIDAIGRGNSGNPGDMDAPDFDDTFGGRTSFEYLKSLPYVDQKSVGLMGHSLGAEMVYNIALEDPSVRALVISGFAYRQDATPTKPQNMLMIFGQYDEYRERMTGTNDVATEWMKSPATQGAFAESDPKFGVVYGKFVDGSARKVVLLPVIHLKESHSKVGVAAAVEWMRAALNPSSEYWIDAHSQTWEVKEYATLVAMLSGLASVLPLGLVLLRTRLFASLQGQIADNYTCSKNEFLKYSAVNGLLMWIYLPIILTLFAIHIYVVQIDKVFPMMLVNGTVWWFLWVNVIGFLILRGWYKRRHQDTGLTWSDLGISFQKDRFALDWGQLCKSALLALILFGYAYLLEHILEQVFIVDYRFIFPFASDLTPYRFGMWLLYFPFLLVGFVLMGFFLHGQLRLPSKGGWFKTFWAWSQANTLAMIIPLILFMLVQYIPLFTIGVIPFVGPGGMLANFTMSLFHIIGVLIMVVPISTWFYQLTGRPYVGAILNAAIVTWMFVSSQVIAPIPV